MSASSRIPVVAGWLDYSTKCAHACRARSGQSPPAASAMATSGSQISATARAVVQADGIGQRMHPGIATVFGRRQIVHVGADHPGVFPGAPIFIAHEEPDVLERSGRAEVAGVSGRPPDVGRGLEPISFGAVSDTGQSFVGAVALLRSDCVESDFRRRAEIVRVRCEQPSESNPIDLDSFDLIPASGTRTGAIRESTPVGVGHRTRAPGECRSSGCRRSP